MSNLQLGLWEKMKKEEREDKFDAQQEYCERHSDILFVINADDECNFCGHKLLDYYNLEDCAMRHITKCVHCSHSLTE